MRTNRRGIALVAALSLMTLLGLLVIGAVAATSISQRAERLASSGGPLSAAADYGIATVLGDPAVYSVADLPFGATRVVDLTADGNVGVSVGITRLRGEMVWLTAEARSTDGADLRRRLNLIARFNVAGPTPPSPLVARGSIRLGDDVIVGADSAGAPDCLAPAVSPTIQTLDSVALFQAAWQRALLDSAASTRHVLGDTTISSGSFSGILIVNGSLTIDGAFDLRGLAIVDGPIRTTRSGLRVTGALVSRASGSTPAIDIAGATIRYSPCAVSLALRRIAALRPVAGRAWVEMF